LPKSSIEVPCVGSLVRRYSENPSVWRRERRAGCSNLETYLSVCDWSTISKLYLLFTLHWFILFISYLICLVCLCVPHLCWTKRSLHSTSTLIQRNLEEIVQSHSLGIQLHSLVTLSVLQFIFNSTLFVIRLAIHLFTSPLGVLTSGSSFFISISLSLCSFSLCVFECNVWNYVCVCRCVFIIVCMCECKCVCVNFSLCMRMCMYVCIYVCVRVCVYCVCIYI